MEAIAAPGDEKRPDPVMPFGQYRGQRCSRIDDVKYLDWLIGQDWLGEILRQQIEEHLGGRADWHALGRD